MTQVRGYWANQYHLKILAINKLHQRNYRVNALDANDNTIIAEDIFHVNSSTVNSSLANKLSVMDNINFVQDLLVKGNAIDTRLDTYM